MTYYEKKRRKAKMKATDVANQLGVDYNRYKMIEKGKVKMPMTLIDKFNEIMNKGEVNKIETHEREKDINEWYDVITAKDDNGHFKIKRLMNDFNVPSYKQLAKLIGYKSSGTLSSMICEPNKASYLLKSRLYDFFHNELNIQDPSMMNVERKKPQQKTKKDLIDLSISSQEQAELLKWWTTHNFYAIMQEKGIMQKTIAEYANVSESQIVRLKKKKCTPRFSTIKKIKEYLENCETQSCQEPVETVVIDNEPKYEMEQVENGALQLKLTLKYMGKIEEINGIIKEQKELVEEYAEKIRLTQIDIDANRMLVSTYESFIKDINEEE